MLRDNKNKRKCDAFSYFLYLKIKIIVYYFGGNKKYNIKTEE